MTDKTPLKRITERMSIDRAEHVALGSTALAFALTVVLAGTGYAIESNGFAASSIEALGWVGAGIVALVGEVLIIEGYRRIVAPRYPLVALVGSWSVASIGVVDVLYNVWVLSEVGLPPGVSTRLQGTIAIVTLAGALLTFRERVSRGTLSTIEGHKAKVRTAGIVGLIVVLSMGGIAPFSVAPAADSVSADTPGEFVYSGTNGNKVYKTNAADGSQEWSYSTGDTVRNVVQGPDGDAVYASGDDSNNAETLRKIHANGSLAWKTGEPGDTWGPMDVSTDGETVYFGNDVGDLYAINTDDGSVKWSVSTSAGTIWTLSVGPDGNIAIGDGDGDVSQYDSTGSLLWSERIYSGIRVRGMAAGNGGERIYTGGNDVGRVSAISTTDGSIIWNATHHSNSVESVAASRSDDVVYSGGTDDSVIAMDASDGSKLWTYNQGENDNVKDIAAGRDGDYVYFGEGNGYTKLKSSDGSEVSVVGLGSTTYGISAGAEYAKVSTNSETDGYKQTFVLDDRSGLFPVDRSTISLYSWDPAAKSLDGPTSSSEWEYMSSKKFNSQAEATFSLTDGDYYRIEVSRGGNSWEIIGYLANKSRSTTQIVIKEPSLIEPATPTPTPTQVTPTPTRTPFPNGSTYTPTPTPTPTSGVEGPAVLGSCEVSGEEGLQVEYWDPNYETVSFDYNLSGPDERVYEGTKTFDEAIGYYRGCISNEALNETDPEEVDGGYSGEFENGTSFDGSLSFPSSSGGSFVGGPVGGGSSTTSTATTAGGWLILIAGGALAYRRFGNGQIGRLASSATETLTGLVGR